MNIEPLSVILGTLTACMPAIGAAVYARNQWKASNRSDSDQVLRAAEHARDVANIDCEKHIARIERRLDVCEEKHATANELIAELAGMVGAPGLARRARSTSPPQPMVAVKEEKIK